MGAKRVEYHEGCQRGREERHHQRRSRKAALEFIEELHRATETIRANPERWPLGQNSTRRFLLWRFPFSIINSEEELVVRVWAVAHASRRPEYWAGRL